MKKKLIFSLICFMLLTGCGKEEKKEAETNKINTFSAENVTLETVITEDDKLMIKLSNKGTELIDLLDVDVAFYKDQELLKTGDAFVKDLEMNKDGYTYTELPKDASGSTIEPTKIDVKVHKNVYETKTIESYVNQVKVTHTVDQKDANKITLTVENSSKQVLNEVEIATLFYKDGKIVGILTSYLMNVKEKATTVVYVPAIVKNSSAEYIKYDEIKFSINHAIKNK